MLYRGGVVHRRLAGFLHDVQRPVFGIRPEFKGERGVRCAVMSCPQHGITQVPIRI